MSKILEYDNPQYAKDELQTAIYLLIQKYQEKTKEKIKQIFLEYDNFEEKQLKRIMVL